MISLSRGSLKEIFERNLHANSAMLHCWSDAKHMRISLHDKASPVCIQIVGSEFLTEFDSLLVLLFDGTLHKTAIVDKSLWHRLDAANALPPSPPSIQLGSIVILYEYAFELVHSFVGCSGSSQQGHHSPTPKQFAERALAAFAPIETVTAQTTTPSVMKLLDFTIIGTDEKLEYYHQQRQVVQQQQQQQQQQRQSPTPAPTPPLACKPTSTLPSPSPPPPPPPPTSVRKFNIVDTRGWQAKPLTSKAAPIAIGSLARLPIDSTTWTIKACVHRLGVPKSFTNKHTGVPGVLQRVLFKDESGLVEALAFDGAIKALNLAHLKLNQSYFVCNAKLGIATRHRQEWFGHFHTSTVEIKLFGTAKIVESTLLDDDDTSSSSATNYVPMASSRSNDDDDDDNDNNVDFVQNDGASFLARQLAHTAHVPDVGEISRHYVNARIAAAAASAEKSTTTSKVLPKSNHSPMPPLPPFATTTTQFESTSYTKLDAIKNKLKKNEWVNTMGVLVSVGKCESAYVTTNRSRVDVRRIDILDESQTKMSVALWGAQAQNFSSPIDCILILHNVKVAYFNGISLSIYKQSQIVEYNHVFNNSNAQALKHWYDSFVSRKLAPMQPTLAPAAHIDQDEGLGGGGEKQA
jgi:hypothetical protein